VSAEFTELCFTWLGTLISSHLLKALCQAAVRVTVSYPSYLLEAVVGKAHATLLLINRAKLQYFTATPV